MSHRPALIDDVGVAGGEDSSYYLRCADRVVGIEANPIAARLLRERFRDEIEGGRYILLEIGIGEEDGEACFWVCDDQPEWSSFDRSVANRDGSRHHRVTVVTRRFAGILREFGIPTYCKIDIEGNDDLCVRDLTPETRPPFLSIEVNEGDGQIQRLAKLGYTRFKLISQVTLGQPGKWNAAVKPIVPAWARNLVTRVEAKLLRHSRDAGWRFPYGASGPFGENSKGKWLNAEEARELNEMIVRSDHFAEWFDIHAAL